MALSVHLPDVRDRARAAFLGLAVGDALGATVEFMTAGEIRASIGVHHEVTGGGWLRLRPGQVTDDTEMSVCLAQAIDAAGGWSARAAAERLARWLRARPIDVGNTCRAGIRRFMLEGTLEGPPGEWDAGNGGAMRVLPVALLTLADPAALRRAAVEQARLTHHHPLSDAACVLLGRLVHLASLGLSLGRMRAAAAEAAREEPRLGHEPYRGLSTGYVVDTIQTVLHFLFSTRSFEDCLVAVVNQGGDADTTGAIAGAVAGAYYGLEGLPRRWTRKLDRVLVAELSRLADRLVDLSPVARGAAPEV
ncbi:MAG TPA: ADP-ribosyl-[dinitrogen reductase] hydrolase [Anaeromyxobacter sp.]|nr:ADP-ribosyl-[dinitrogen reductase] hydrolase [Anaeromyxobacter sp.]